MMNFKIDYNQYIEKWIHVKKIMPDYDKWIFKNINYTKAFSDDIFNDMSGEKFEIVADASLYLLIYIKLIDNLLDCKGASDAISFLNVIDFINNSWKKFMLFTENNSCFEQYWHDHIRQTIDGLEKRLQHIPANSSSLWRMSSFICLTPISLCLATQQIHLITPWIKIIQNTFIAKQMIDDLYDFIEDAKYNTFNSFEYRLTKQARKNNIINVFRKSSLLHIEEADHHLDESIKICKRLNANNWLSLCLVWKKEISALCKNI